MTIHPGSFGPPEGGRTVADDQPLRAFPAQLVEVEDGAIVVRGSTQMKVAGAGALDAVVTLYRRVAAGGQTRGTLVEAFGEPDRPAVTALVDHLIARRLFGPAGAPAPPPGPAEAESALDVFYWSFGLDGPAVTRELGTRSVKIFGVNAVSRQLAVSLGRLGLGRVAVVDHPLLRNVRLFPDAGERVAGWDPELPAIEPVAGPLEDQVAGCDAAVACADFAATTVLQDLNRAAVAAGVPFLPAMLAHLVGRLGPLVVPGQTPCYECLVARENSHLRDAAARRRTEAVGPQGQWVDGAHPSMGSVLGDLAAMELTKFLVSPLLRPQVGRLITVYLLGPSVDTRRVLRVPRCPVCSRYETQSTVSVSRYDFVPGNQFVPGGGDERAYARLAAERKAGAR